MNLSDIVYWELENQLETHECDSIDTDLCLCKFEYICLQCNQSRIILGEDITDFKGICDVCWLDWETKNLREPEDKPYSLTEQDLEEIIPF